MDCALKTLRNKGPLEFYTGFPTYCVRIAPHAALTLVFVAWLPRLQAKVRTCSTAPGDVQAHAGTPNMQRPPLLLLQVGL